LSGNYNRCDSRVPDHSDVCVAFAPDGLDCGTDYTQSIRVAGNCHGSALDPADRGRSAFRDWAPPEAYLRYRVEVLVWVHISDYGPAADPVPPAPERWIGRRDVVVSGAQVGRFFICAQDAPNRPGIFRNPAGRVPGGPGPEQIHHVRKRKSDFGAGQRGGA